MENHISIRDPIHGFITLKGLEINIIQAREFQRLRFIHQLGPTYLIYPSSNHTRFEHSLGVAELSTRVIYRLKRFSELDIAEEDERIFKLACCMT